MTQLNSEPFVFAMLFAMLVSKIKLKELIESIPDIATKEMVWHTAPRMPWVDVAKDRAQISVNIKPELMNYGTTSIHTHCNALAVASADDLRMITSITPQFAIIAAVTEDGKVAGYTYVQKRKPGPIPYFEKEAKYDLKTMDRLSKILRKDKEEIERLDSLPFSVETYCRLNKFKSKRQRLLNLAIKLSLSAAKKGGFKIKFVPLKGFKLLGGYFVPDAVARDTHQRMRQANPFLKKGIQKMPRRKYQFKKPLRQAF